MPSLTQEIRSNEKLHRMILDEVKHRVRMSQRAFVDAYRKWDAAEDDVLAYMPERDVDRLRRQKREGGLPQYTTLVVPYTYGVLMASHTFWTNVFLSRTPIFQYQGLHGEGEQQVQAMEALIGYQVSLGELLPPLYSWLYDTGRYGVGVIGIYWDREVYNYSQIVIDPEGRKQQVTLERQGYQGNRIFNVRPRDFIPDWRVSVRDFQKGEFCAIRCRISWNDVKRRERQGWYTNVDKIDKDIVQDFETNRESGSSLRTPSSLHMDNTEGFFKRPKERNHPDIVPVYECYIEIIPKEWGISQSDYPETWVFTVTADYKTVIGVQPLGYYHNRFPFQTLEMEPDAYALVNRGVPEVIGPIQDTMDWLLNTHFYNIRAALNNMIVADPSRVVMKDLLDPAPGKVIRLKPTAYGTDIKAAFQQFPVADVTQRHVADLQTMLQIGERTLGVNDNILGVVDQSSRKTATEVRQSSGFGVSRLKASAEYMSAVGFAPLGRMLAQNSQQYYNEKMKFRVVGDLAHMAGENFMNVTPDDIKGQFDFVPVDGTLPVDRFAQAALWKDMVGQMANFPAIMQQFDMAKIFTWVAQLAGLKNINLFRVEMGSPQQLMQMAQTGQMVPMGGGQRQQQNGAVRPQVGQIPGVGPVA